MTYNARRHDLPAVLVQPDAPLSSDVTGRTVEAIEYVWQVTTGTADAAGGELLAPQGHTHDGKADQTLEATSAAFTGWAFGFGAPRLVPDSPDAPDAAKPHFLPNGGWANALVTGPLIPIRGQVEVPFGVAGTNVAFSVHCLIEKGGPLVGANNVQVTVVIGGVGLLATSAAVATGLELITVGPFPAGSFLAGSQEMLVEILTTTSADFARLWHAAAVT